MFRHELSSVGNWLLLLQFVAVDRAVFVRVCAYLLLKMRMSKHIYKYLFTKYKNEIETIQQQQKKRT